MRVSEPLGYKEKRSIRCTTLVSVHTRKKGGLGSPGAANFDGAVPELKASGNGGR
jgi:hypothetical protein